jgi:hypothetical protein
LQDETEYTLDTLSDDEIEILPDNPYIATRKVLLKVDYPIKDELNIPYKLQYPQNFTYNIQDYNQSEVEEDVQYMAMRQVDYKLKYPELQNLRYNTNTNPPTISLELTANDIEAGFIGFHDFAEIPTQNYSPNYNTNSTDISVDPVLQPNTVVFDPVAITPYDKLTTVNSMRGITRDSSTFEPPFYAVDFKNDINVARVINVSPQNFPYTFSIANYNNDNNTNYVGVRSLVINGSPVIKAYDNNLKYVRITKKSDSSRVRTYDISDLLLQTKTGSNYYLYENLKGYSASVSPTGVTKLSSLMFIAFYTFNNVRYFAGAFFWTRYPNTGTSGGPKTLRMYDNSGLNYELYCIRNDDDNLYDGNNYTNFVDLEYLNSDQQVIGYSIYRSVTFNSSDTYVNYYMGQSNTFVKSDITLNNPNSALIYDIN